MKVTLKLYAQLGRYLPEGTAANEAEVAITQGMTISALLDLFNVPEAMCHLVLVNGTYVEPSARATHVLNENDHLAVWPPVAGG